MNFDRIRITLLILLIPLTLFSVGCSARPEESDLTRVKEYFLQLRFQASFNPEYRSRTDRELFEISCEKNRVKCDPLLEMLKEKDPAFYETLTRNTVPESR